MEGLTAMNVRGLPWLLRTLGRPLVFDFDDAVHLAPPQAFRSRLLAWLTDPGQVRALIRDADVVVAGNAHLAGVAAGLNPEVEVVVTAMDTAWYAPRPIGVETGPPVVGWSGSSTTPIEARASRP